MTASSINVDFNSLYEAEFIQDHVNTFVVIDILRVFYFFVDVCCKYKISI